MPLENLVTKAAIYDGFIHFYCDFRRFHSNLRRFVERLFTNTFWRADSMPRELFVPAVNERVGMNDRGRPSGSPLRHPRFCCADSLSVHRRVRAGMASGQAEMVGDAGRRRIGRGSAPEMVGDAGRRRIGRGSASEMVGGAGRRRIGRGSASPLRYLLAIQ